MLLKKYKRDIFVFMNVSFYDKLYILFNKFFGVKVCYWDNCRELDEFFSNNLCSFYINKNESRKIFENYFENYSCSAHNNSLIVQYIKKLLMNDFDRYYSFMTFIKSQNNTYYKVVGGGVFKYIYENKEIPRVKIIWVYYIFSIIKLCIVIFRDAYKTIVSKGSLDRVDIIYLRRKNLPDAFKHSFSFFRKNKIKFSCVIFQFSKVKTSYGLSFLSSFKHSTNAVIKSILSLPKIIIKDTRIFYNMSVDNNYYYLYLRELFYVLVLVELNPKVIYGSLIERSYGTLIYRQKKNFQKLCMFGDGFNFDPIPGPDYIYSDVFYSLNIVDSKNINNYGGNVHKTKEIGFYRNDVRASSQGISNKVYDLVHKYDKVIIVTLNTARHGYYPTSVEYLNQFVSLVVSISKHMKEVAFIFKGKKGESKALSDYLLNEINLSPNTYLVPSDSPYTLKNNHFEDLLGIANLVISMHFASTTIWQSLEKKIPAIGFCYCDFYVKYDHINRLISRKEDLYNDIHYWLNISDRDLNLFFENKELKWLFRKDSLYTMYEDMYDMLFLK